MWSFSQIKVERGTPIVCLFMPYTTLRFYVWLWNPPEIFEKGKGAMKAMWKRNYLSFKISRKIRFAIADIDVHVFHAFHRNAFTFEHLFCINLFNSLEFRLAFHHKAAGVKSGTYSMITNQCGGERRRIDAAIYFGLVWVILENSKRLWDMTWY